MPLGVFEIFINSRFEGLHTYELVKPPIFPYDAPLAGEMEKSASHHFESIFFFFFCAAARRFALE